MNLQIKTCMSWLNSDTHLCTNTLVGTWKYFFGCKTRCQNIWDIESVKTKKFNFEPNKFLELILDEPKMPNYVTAAGSNSILDLLTHHRAQGIYEGGGVPDSAAEQF